MITISTNNSIQIDGANTGLKVTQVATGTIVYTPETSGQAYREHSMPHARYSLSHDNPASGVAGRIQFEKDIRALLSSL